TEFAAVGGYDLTLEGTRYLGADLGRRLSASGSGVAIETTAVAFVPHPPDGLYRLPAYGLASRPGETATARPDIAPAPARILWAAAHLPDRNRSGIDARHFEMIEALAGTGAEVVVWAEHDSGARPVGQDLSATGIRWVAPPPDHRWALGERAGPDRWLRDLLGGVAWDTVVIAEPRLAGWITPQIASIAPQARAVVDLGTARFVAPGAGDAPTDAIDSVLPRLDGIDGIVVATAADARVLGAGAPGLPAFVFTALGREPTTGGGPTGDLLFIGDLFHHPNRLALEWWMDAIAAPVEAHLGRPAPLRVVGHGADAHRAEWNHPRKVDIAGWQPDLSAEFARARVLVVPLTTVTGTGGRIAAALGHGVPVVASEPAAAVLPGDLAGLIDIGEDAAELAEKIVRLMSDDDAWEAARTRITAVDFGGRRAAQATALEDWRGRLTASPGADDGPIPTRRTRRARRRRRRAS
ncbi:MAG: glycosyltransferase family 4 protein, partial [Acidimicrobiia bacterium]|nr:glycosyltransferase family 4 protein [Acidimicrobiia bacterium]